MTKKVAVLFFGLTRSVNDTIESIQQCLFQPILDAGMEYDVFLHTYQINGSYHNRWSNEHVKEYDNEQYKLLNPKYFVSDIQEEILSTVIRIEDYFTHLGCWTGFKEDLTRFLIRNMVLALYSKKRITEILEKHVHEYDYVIITRPDLKYTTPIPFTDIVSPLTDCNIIIPSQEWWLGCNDKMCICKPNIGVFVGKLYDNLLFYSTKKSIVSELFFKDMLDTFKIHILSFEINYQFIRCKNNAEEDNT